MVKKKILKALIILNRLNELEKPEFECLLGIFLVNKSFIECKNAERHYDIFFFCRKCFDNYVSTF